MLEQPKMEEEDPSTSLNQDILEPDTEVSILHIHAFRAGVKILGCSVRAHETVFTYKSAPLP